jgi:hypothetical protein
LGYQVNNGATSIAAVAPKAVGVPFDGEARIGVFVVGKWAVIGNLVSEVTGGPNATAGKLADY